MTVSRVSRASILLGALGLASFVFVVVLLAERWRVSPSAASHHISLLGQNVSYPAANLAALSSLGLALVGLGRRRAGGGGRGTGAGARLPGSFDAWWRGQVARAIVFEDEQPRAFCAGLLRPRVYVAAIGSLSSVASARATPNLPLVSSAPCVVVSGLVVCAAGLSVARRRMRRDSSSRCILSHSA